MTKGYVYKITNNKTSDIYIGSTIQELKNRFKTHKSNVRIGKISTLYDYMRQHGIDNFIIELIEECDGDELDRKEKEFYEKLSPSLNMIAPRINKREEIGRIYKLVYSIDPTQFYIGSTRKKIHKRLGDHRSMANNGTTPLYKFMKEKGKDNFDIECLEDNIPIDQLITRENYWINERKPSLNKNTNLCMTDKERDRLKYIKNREKRLVQVNERRILKRDEINTQKMEHYHANKDRINKKDKDKRKELREKEIVLYEQTPLFTKETLNPYTVFQLKEIAKRFGMTVSPKLKPSLIEKILDKQKIQFTS
jgi:group I intron endonuclease